MLETPFCLQSTIFLADCSDLEMGASDSPASPVVASYPRYIRTHLHRLLYSSDKQSPIPLPSAQPPAPVSVPAKPQEVDITVTALFRGDVRKDITPPTLYGHPHGLPISTRQPPPPLQTPGTPPASTAGPLASAGPCLNTNASASVPGQDTKEERQRLEDERLKEDVENKIISQPLPSALATARNIQDIYQIQYPEGIKSPKPELNANAKDGKFR